MPATCILDSFNRANNTTSLGAADTGELWIDLLGAGNQMGINANEAYHAGASIDGHAVINAGISDATIESDAPTVATPVGQLGSWGLSFRVVDASNFLFIQRDGIYSIVAPGGATRLVFVGSADFIVSGDHMKIVLDGQAISVFRNGTAWLSVNSSTHLTATRHGLFLSASGASASRWDNYSICPLSRSPGYVPPLRVGQHDTGLPPGIAGPPLRAGPKTSSRHFSPRISAARWW